MIVFTLNEFYGANRTIVFDEKLQQNVTLFPGI
jgi:hypothetical protein